MAASDSDLGRSHVVAVAVNTPRDPALTANLVISIKTLTTMKNVYLSTGEVFLEGLCTGAVAELRMLSLQLEGDYALPANAARSSARQETR